MTLDEARVITSKMTMDDHKNPTPEQRQAKYLIYNQVIRPKYGDAIAPHLEPDFMEGWK